MTDSQAGAAKRVGRPRDARVDAAILAAAAVLLDEHGYPPLTLEKVAHRAGTTRPALYRRWRSRAHLVLDALAPRIAETPVPDTGCTICDLNEGVQIFVRVYERLRPDVLGPLLAECATDADLRRSFMASLFEPPRRAVAQLLANAVARGDLRGDLDSTLAVDTLGSFIHYRALFGHAPVSGTEIERAVEALLCGFATDYEALVEHARSVPGRTQRHAAHLPEGG
ncbi:MAG: TetR family transcriptional regulator [Streptosporangiales bacterium]|nr:TetR family transcriptional regulator [Streptosporangiales bacterium]